MPTEKEIYQAHADEYEQLILREDFQKNIIPAIQKITSFRNCTIIELGAGTGRLTREMQNFSKHVYAGDASHHMVSKASHIVNNQSKSNVTLYVCDMRANPIKSRSADIVIAGWSFCYLAVWCENNWKAELQKGS